MKTSLVLALLLGATTLGNAQTIEFTSDSENPTIIDVDGIPPMEVITIGPYAHNGFRGVRIFDASTGALKFEWYPLPENGYSHLDNAASPLIQDPDLDTVADILFRGEGPSGLYAWHWFRGLTHVLSAPGSMAHWKQPVLAQADGDPALEMVLIQGLAGNRLVVLDGLTGTEEFAWTPSNGGELTTLHVRDVDDDGLSEIVVTGFEPGSFHDRRHYIIQTSGTPSGIDTAENGGGVRLGLPSPNPSSSGSQFAITLDRPTPVTIRIVDTAGRVVSKILDEVVLAAGNQTVAWEGIDTNGHVAPSGVYYAEVTGGGVTKVQRIVLVR